MLNFTKSDFRVFWEVWATKHAQHAWRIYRGSQPCPPVVGIVMNTMEGVFEVTFEGGEVFDVEVTGMARVRVRNPSA